ncbi:MAG: hypothetical protein UW18_C0020G0006 [Microgenomates group bacterium GW2011_GWF1_44_10]|nr:MAG: hypothetical protein UW18_C0020G0006 [Microgenomates group bacterium GW2011_GWF1_44_10]
MLVCYCAIPAMYGGCGNCPILRQKRDFYGYRPEEIKPIEPIDYDKLALKLHERMRKANYGE